MDFTKFYYIVEESAIQTSMKALWKSLFDAKLLNGYDIHIGSKPVKVISTSTSVEEFMEEISTKLKSNVAELYITSPTIMRAEASKDFVQKIQKIGGFEIKSTFKKSRPVIYVTKDGVTLTLNFKNNIKNKIRAIDYENAIVEVWNGQKISKSQLQEPVEKIVEQLKGQIKQDLDAEHTGALKLDKNALSEFWQKGIKRPDTTPKPDLNIGDEEYKISLKIGFAAQLCSSKIIGGEGYKLIVNSLNKSGVNEKIKRDIEEMISKRDTNYVLAKGSKKDYEKNTKSKIVEYHEQLTEMLNEASETPLFKQSFIEEAMTGNVKFKDGRGKANYMLSAPYDGSSINFKKISQVDFMSIAKQVRLYVAFKSGASGSMPWSVVRAEQKFSKDEEPVQQNNSYDYVGGTLKYFEEKADELGIEYKTLNEKFDIGDWISRIFNIIKNAINKGIEFLLKLFGIKPEIENLDQTGINFLNV